MPGRQSAFTLTELLFCICILLIISAASSSGFASLLHRESGSAVILQLVRLMNFARHSAVTNGKHVTMCRSSSGSKCEGKWLQGILIFTDSNRDRKINQGDQVLRYSKLADSRGSLILRSFPNRQFIQYTPMGFTTGQSGNFTWCASSGDASQARQVIFTKSGRPRLAEDRDQDGIREGANGKALQC